MVPRFTTVLKTLHEHEEKGSWGGPTQEARQQTFTRGENHESLAMAPLQREAGDLSPPQRSSSKTQRAEQKKDFKSSKDESSMDIRSKVRGV